MFPPRRAPGGSAGARRLALVASISVLSGLRFLRSDVQPVAGQVFGGFSTCESGEKKIRNPGHVVVRLGGGREHAERRTRGAANTRRTRELTVVAKRELQMCLTCLVCLLQLRLGPGL